jgi:MFS transporter, DHA2 family, methylenomycin A resistance protein
VRRAAASLPLAVVLLDVTAVAVLLPDIRLDLGSSTTGGQWVLNAYLLALAALLPLLARLTLPRRALVVAAALAMAAGAVVCAAADSTSVLVAGRAVQGAGAAAMLACVGAASWSGPGGALPATALPAVALALGPLVGGVFAEQNWWRVFFWAGVPLAAVAAGCALAAPRPERQSPGRDAVRRLAFAVGLTAAGVAMVQSEVWSWGWSALLLLVGAALLGRALQNELPVAALVWATLAGCLAALLFLVPEYFQLARNLSGSRSGVLLLAVTLPAVGSWALTPWLWRRVPLPAAVLVGAISLGAGLAILVPIDSDTRYALLIGGLGLAGAGLGVIAAAVPRLPWFEAPSRPLAPAFAGAALGLASAGSAFQSAQADERRSGASFEQALAAGVGWAAVFLLFLLAATALLAWRLPRRAKPASSAARPAAGS